MAESDSMTIVTIVGARPQFIKAATLSRAIAAWNAAGRRPVLRERLVHTGQHYDENMSQVFFDELGIPEPIVNLEVGSGPHGQQTGRMIEGIEQVLIREKPDLVVAFGDTNTTLAGALAGVKLHVPVAHVEAGLRSFNRRMPEEVNRVVADHVATLLLCPTDRSVANLRAEGVTEGVHQVGDVMLDSALYNAERARATSGILSRLGVRSGAFCLATVHRAHNADDPKRLAAIMDALKRIDMPVVLPLHPRTRKALGESLRDNAPQVILTGPVSYFDMLTLLAGARVVLADSGGVQKEAFFFGVPCVTMTDETEWVELVEAGWNQLAGADAERILNAVAAAKPGRKVAPYGDGRAAERIVEIIATREARPGR